LDFLAVKNLVMLSERKIMVFRIFQIGNFASKQERHRMPSKKLDFLECHKHGLVDAYLYSKLSDS